ncbi:glutathione S-transferase U17-like protein [Carex littledalei]|uniref:glutathione transferase n=1 Tax=Carex littledalei TaxID=544730 RepID=A0A833RB52_9POAL|nr:glutathione S-transferase U17-like protein [Carex littledalei]
MAASANPEVKLLGIWFSPFVLRARIALNLKEVQYQFLEEQLGTKSDLLLESNPVYKKMPVLIHEGKPVCESLIIVQYIDDVWAGSGTTLMPTDAYERAIHRFWTVYVDDKLYSSFLDSIMRYRTDEAKAEAEEQAVAALQLLEETFDKISKGKPFFGGDTIGYLDIALGSFLGWIRAAEINGLKLLDHARIPLLCAWAEKFCNNEAVRAVIPDTMKLAEFTKVLRSSYQNRLPPAK